MQILEREHHLKVLDELLQSAHRREGRVALVAGEAGVGKSSLVRSFCESLPDQSAVHVGYCDPLATPRPLGPLLDIAPGLSDELAELLYYSGARYRVFQAFMQAAGTRSGGASVIVIEDAHWADEATLDFLRFVGRRVQSIAALLFVTYRNDEVGRGHPLQLVLGDIISSSAVTRLQVSPLSEGAVRVLAAGSSHDVGKLFQRTRGNPFYVTEVLAHEGEGIPVTVRDAVLARAGRLSHSARSVLDVAAVIGPVVPASLLAEVTQADGETVEECLAIGVLDDLPDGYAFRHELGRDSILEAIPDHRIVQIHRAVLEALEGWGTDSDFDGLARLAHHAEGARDARAVLEYAPAAAHRAVSLNSHREAVSQYARALRWSNNLEDERHAEILECYADECSRADLIDESIRARAEAIEIRRALGDVRSEGMNLTVMASTYSALARTAESDALSREAISLLETLPPGRELASAYRTEAQLRMLDRDTPGAVYWGEKAIELAQQLDDQFNLIGAEQAIGAALIVSSDIRGVEYMTRALQRARTVGHEELESLALGNLGSGLGEVYAFDQAIHWLEESIAFSIERDHDRHHYYSKAWLVLVLVYMGEWTRSGALAHQVVDRPEVSTISRIMALVALGRLRTRRGDPEAHSALDLALELAIESGTLQRLAPVRAARAELAWLTGDLDSVRSEASACYELAASQQHNWFTGELLYWQWKAGASVDVPEWAASPFAMQVKGDWETSAQKWRDLGCPYETARALSESGDEAALRDGLAICESLGAGPLASMIQRKLRELGVRNVPRGPRKSTKQNPAGLTQREYEVLKLLSEGSSNQVIADRLYLSPRTVEHHVSSILGKLEVQNRSEAARVAVRILKSDTS
jgi:DNA-binding CsgD family transcriptional regulator/tetratricopeptide (TPR) repeat protein/GTPase SAR1 family protein